MIKLLMIADDFTGALDSGVKFAQSGASTIVISQRAITENDLECGADVLVVDAQTRHLTAQEAYRIVHDMTAVAAKYKEIWLYKKTDSALRGNVGSELTAMLDASGEKVMAFVPAFPQQNRITVHSVQLADGKPISEGVFGKDLFDPITCSYIPELIAQQSNVKTEIVLHHCYETVEYASEECKILIFDAECEEDLQDVANKLKRSGGLRVMAGCAGMAFTLPDLIELNGNPSPFSLQQQRLGIVCGSVNPISQRQLETGEAAGFGRYTFTAEALLGKSFDAKRETKRAIETLKHRNGIIIDANDLQFSGEKLEYASSIGLDKEQTRMLIAERLGSVACCLLEEIPEILLTLIGGDTLAGFMEQMQIIRFLPIRELSPGCVLSIAHTETRRFPVISKSGGLGCEDLLPKLLQFLSEERTGDRVYA